MYVRVYIGIRVITNVTLVNGEHFTMKESADEIRSMIKELEK